jgi:hypothetical protein
MGPFHYDAGSGRAKRCLFARAAQLLPVWQIIEKMTAVIVQRAILFAQNHALEEMLELYSIQLVLPGSERSDGWY